MDSWLSPRRMLLAGVGTIVTLLLILPVLVVLPVSLTTTNSLVFPPPAYSIRWYEHLLSDPGWWGSLVLSVQVGLGTAALSLVLGVPMALGLVRGRIRGRGVLFGLVLSPLVIPTIIVGTGMFYVWALGWQIGPISVGGGLYGTSLGIVLAHSALAIPLVVVLVIASIRTVDPDLELAARGLGATPAGALRHVLLPLILPAVLAAAAFAFLTSWDEPIIALFLSSPTLITLPVRLFIQTRDAVDPTVAAVSILLAAFTTLLFLTGFALRRRG